MKDVCRGFSLLLLVVALCPGRVCGQDRASLSPEEADKVREAQDPGDRIVVYLDLERARLEQFEEVRKRPPDPQYNTGDYLDKLLGQYLALNDELKDWIDYQYQRMGDMRKGLRALLDQGPRQLEELKQIQQTPDAYSADYRDTLNDTLADLNDTLDGATKALAEQEKKFGELKREEKAQVREAKESVKGEKKREKEEKKLRRKESKHGGVPEDPDQN